MADTQQSRQGEKTNNPFLPLNHQGENPSFVQSQKPKSETEPFVEIGEKCESEPPAPLAVETLSKTILKFAEPAVLNQRLTMPVISERAMEAMYRLVAIITQLLSPAGGWPSNLPQTSENLAPYVTDEAYEVLDALENEEVLNSQFSILNSKYIFVEDLIPKLLWYIAKSSDELMRLIGGVKARVNCAGEEWKPGILRLITILKATATDITWSVDLATHQPLSSHKKLTIPFTTDTLIKLDEGHLDRQSIPVENLLNLLRQHLLAGSPEIGIFIEPMNVEMLAPSDTWKAGKIQLSLDFEFIADEEKVTGTAAQEFELSEIEEQQNSKLTRAGEINVNLTDSILLKHYSQTLVKQQLCVIIAQKEKNKEEETPDQEKETAELLTSPPLLPGLVNAAFNLVGVIPTPAASETATFLPHPILLDDLMHRLLWHIISSSYEVMQMVGGVKAGVLQPENPWQTGTLRLLAMLKITSSGFNCELDLTTAQVPQSNRLRLNANAIIQFQESLFVREPVVAKSLLRRLRKQLQEMTPEISLLMKGTPVELFESNLDWPAAFMELSFDFELII